MSQQRETAPSGFRTARRATVLGALCLLVGACATARVESEPSAEGAATVDVTLAEFEIEMPRTLDAGRVTFEVRNAGTMEHNFEVEGEGVHRNFPSDLDTGERRSMTLTLSPGTYEVYCPVENHAQRGMRMQLIVTE